MQPSSLRLDFNWLKTKVILSIGLQQAYFRDRTYIYVSQRLHSCTKKSHLKRLAL